MMKDFSVTWRNEEVPRVRGTFVENLSTNVFKNPLLTFDSVKDFLESRRITLTRANRERYFSSPGVCGDLDLELRETLGVSTDDFVWLRPEGSSLC